MQLDSYISDLLYRYDCVTIPQLGAFITNRVSATIDSSNHTLYPPKKVLSFNEQLQHNDGLLCNYLSEIDKIPYLVAVEKIAKHVSAVKSRLIEGETIHLDNIGELVLNAEGNMVFEPTHNINYLTDAFGLSAFKTYDIQREIHKETVEALEMKAPIALTPEKRSLGWLKYAAAAIIVLGLSGFGAATYFNGQVEVHNQMAQEKANAQLENRVQEATFVIPNPLPAVTLSVEKQTGNYHVVAGAFRIEENSAKKVKQLRQQGYKARAIGVNRYGLHEVVYGSYDNRSEAINAMYSIRRESNPDAWLLVKNLD